MFRELGFGIRWCHVLFALGVLPTAIQFSSAAQAPIDKSNPRLLPLFTVRIGVIIGMTRKIGFLGSLALLVSGLTGPSLVVIPLLYQQAGWLTPLITFALIAFLTGSATLFIVEAMSSIEGNEEFQASIEFTTVAHLFLGKRWHWAVQIVLYVALQALIITSLIESFQSMDSLLISLAHKTCAISVQRGWICTESMLANGSGVFTDYILFSFGTMIAFVMILPLSLNQLTDNIKFQIVSFILLVCISVIWLATCIQVGLHTFPVPVVKSNQSNVVGFVLSNFAFVTTVPAWINNKHPSVNIRLVVWLSLLIACLIYIPIGWMGASAFAMDSNSTILNILSARRPNIVALVSTYIFPLAVLITSVPVFTIVVRYNLLRGDICSNRMAIFLSAVVPWLIAIPFQTRGWIAIILNWTSLVCSSPANLIIPFILYLVSKRYKASALLDPDVPDPPSIVIHRDTEALPLHETATGFEAAHLNELAKEAVPPNIEVTEVVSLNQQMTEAASLKEGSTETETTLLHEPATVNKRARLPLLVTSNLKPETEDYIRLVRSPSRHRYYGQHPDNATSDVSVSSQNKNSASERDISLAVPDSPLSPRSARSTSPGKDEFRLLPIVVPSAMDRRCTPTTAVSPEEPPPVVNPVPPEPVFEAYPFLRRSSWCTSSRVATVECGVTFLLVVAAFVDSIIQAVKPQ